MGSHRQRGPDRAGARHPVLLFSLAGHQQPALARSRTVFVFDHLGFGQSDQREGEDLSLAAHARNFARLLDHWELSRPSVVAHDIGGAVALRTLLLEEREYRDLTLFDAVSGGDWERGLFQLILEHPDVFQQLPDYAHEALVASHMRHATQVGLRPKSSTRSSHRGEGQQGRPRSTASTARSGRRTPPRTRTCSAACRFRCDSSGAARTASSPALRGVAARAHPARRTALDRGRGPPPPGGRTGAVVGLPQRRVPLGRMRGRAGR